MNTLNGVDVGINFHILKQHSASKEVEDLKVNSDIEERALGELVSQSEKKGVESSRIVLSDHSLKELLFLISSKGSSETIEKLVELLKRERELLLRLKR